MIAFSAKLSCICLSRCHKILSQNKMLESLTKSLISVKSRPNANYIRACADLLHLLQKADVQETLLPALHKSMLRSPETIIQAVGVVVENLDVHVDGIAVEIGKSLIGECSNVQSAV